MTDHEEPSRPEDALPAVLRERLNELTEKIENERSSSHEARVLRETEITSMQMEFKKREEAWNMEKTGLLKEVSELKADQETARTERERYAVQQNTITTLEAALRMREETWSTEKDQLTKTMDQLKEEIRVERKHWSNLSAEWNLRFEKLTNAFREEQEKNSGLGEKLQAAESGLKKAEEELERRETEHGRALSELEMRHQTQLNATLKALDSLLAQREAENNDTEQAGRKHPPDRAAEAH